MTDSSDASLQDNENSGPKGVELRVDQLSKEALRGLVEEYITREGTDYGDVSASRAGVPNPHVEWSLEEKVAQVFQQLEHGEAHIVFDIEQETANIVPADALAAHV